MTWKRSSRCDSGACVEVQFKKSTFSDDNGTCVEVYGDGYEWQVRDSKNPEGPVLSFDEEEWAAFTDGVKAGEFDV